ncbi:MAG: phage major capsid protein [Candidatus Acidiferrales bacterium]
MSTACEPPSYRRGAKYMLTDTSLKVIKQLLDKYGRPIWVPGLAVNAPDTILGYNYVINQNMPQEAADANIALFGDMKSFKIQQRSGRVCSRGEGVEEGTRRLLRRSTEGARVRPVLRADAGRVQEELIEGGAKTPMPRVAHNGSGHLLFQVLRTCDRK